MVSNPEVKVMLRQVLWSVGTNIRQFRTEKEWSTVILAGKSGISVSGIQAIETHVKSPNLTTIVKIAMALDVNPGRFFEKPKDEASKK